MADEVDIKSWVRDLMDAPAGYKAYHRREVIIGRPTIYKAVEFAIRALANPKCEGSEQILKAIAEQRERASRESES